MALWERLRNRLRRDMSDWFGRRRYRLALSRPVISFTFDDFPRSALLSGGSILSERGLAGTYYASFGLMGEAAPTGDMFQADDLGHLARARHELGCHTYDHCDAWATTPAAFEVSMARNRQRAAALLPGMPLRSLSYPISCPRPRTKVRAGRHYSCARGGGQTYNVGRVDLNCLRAFFIEQSRDRAEAIEETIAANARANGWLIFATHDISATPTRFGCTPQLFARVVDWAVRSGALILPVAEAWLRVERESRGCAGR